LGEEGVPTVNEFIEQKLKEGGTIGFDGRVVNTRWGLQLKEIAKKKNGALYVEEDLIDLIWKDRSALAKTPMFILEEKIFRKEHKDKIRRAACCNGKRGRRYTYFNLTLRYRMAVKCQRK